MSRHWLFGVLVAAVLLPAEGLAQQLSLGGRFGVNASKFGGEDLEWQYGATESKVGANFGVFLTIALTDLVALQPEVSWTQKGAEESEPWVTARLKLEYVEVPLLARVTTPWGRLVKGYGVAGPALALRFRCQAELDEERAGRGVSSFDCDDPFFQGQLDIKSTELSAVVGGGLGFALGRGQIVADLRYTLGLSSIDDSAAQKDVKNRVLSFSLGFSHRLGL